MKKTNICKVITGEQTSTNELLTSEFFGEFLPKIRIFYNGEIIACATVGVDMAIYPENCYTEQAFYYLKKLYNEFFASCTVEKFEKVIQSDVIYISEFGKVSVF